MDGSIALSPKEREVLLTHYRTSTNPAVRLRVHSLLLLADGRSWNAIATMLYTSPSTTLAGRPASSSGAWRRFWATPAAARRCFSSVGAAGGTLGHQDTARLRVLRSRWSCATIVLLLWEEHRLKSALRQCVAGCIGSRWSGAAPARSSGRPPRSISENYGKSGVCSGTCRLRRRPSFRTRWSCTSIPRSARCGCARASRPRSKRQATTSSGT